MSERLNRILRQSKPFASTEHEVVVALQVATARVVEPLARYLRGEGITLPQYNVLRILRGAGEDGLPSGEIAVRMIDRDPDVTRLVDRLVRDGLAVRDRRDDDRRVVLVRIAAPGLELLARTDAAMAELPCDLLGGLGNEQLETLLALLEDVIEVASRQPATTTEGA
jgi:DNA-binding MarR family transcriptional regulator